jgi:tetratricopeptide (TPR) repeat protein
MLYGEQYARMINASWIVPTCGTSEKEIVRKHFEIPASKACLVTEKSSALEYAGFVDMQNCVFCNDDDVLDKLDYLFENLDELAKIIDSGYQLAHSRHTLKHRDQILQWFNLQKNLKGHQSIVQSNPFQPLLVVEKSSGVGNTHIICNGLVIQFLRQGDEKLWSHQYEEAKALYLQAYHHINSMPEPKLRLTLCSLHQGNVSEAFHWIIQPIKYTLEEYKAENPDPVEWAYLIITLLCKGRLDEAIQCTNQFPELSHLELDRVRWVISLLKSRENKDPIPDGNLRKCRYSVHQLPNRNFNEWIDYLCIILKASKQFYFSKILKNSVVPNYTSMQDCVQSDKKLPDNAVNFIKKESVSQVIETLSLIKALEIEFSQVSRGKKLKAKLKELIKHILNNYLKISLSRLPRN